MARTITVSPVIPSDGGSYELLARSIQAGQESKRRREEALREAILTQQKTNQAIFGNVNGELRRLYDDASSVPNQIRDELFGKMVPYLSQYANSPEFPMIAQQATNEFFKQINKYKSFYDGAQTAVKDLEAQGFRPDTISAFINKTVFDEVINPDGTKTKVRKDISNITDPVNFIKTEVALNPSDYFDPTKISQSAYNEVTKIEKENPTTVSNKVSLDPTGRKTTSLGYSFNMAPWEITKEKKDDVTGLSYKVPALPVSKSVIYRPDSKVQYDEMDPVKYDSFVKSVGQMTKNQLLIGATEKIRTHNEEAFKKAGVANPKALSLAVSQNNVNSFSSVPGFINPYDPSSVEDFKKIYALDLLKINKKYNDNNEAEGITVDRGVNVAAPSTSGAANAAQPIIDVYGGVISKYYGSGAKRINVKKGGETTSIGSPFNILSQNEQSTILDLVNKVAKKQVGAKQENFTQSDLVIGEGDTGELAVFEYKKIFKDGKMVGANKGRKLIDLDRQSLNLRANETLGNTAQQKVVGQQKTYVGMDANGNPIYK